jgi:hypothetical protein
MLGKRLAKCNTDVAATHAKVKKVSLGEWKGLSINFAWTTFSLLWIYLMTCTQDLSTVVELSDRILKDFWGALTIRY